MPSKPKNDCCTDRYILALSSAHQECPVTFKLMPSQVVERARPLSSHMGPLGRQRVNYVLCQLKVRTNLLFRTFAPIPTAHRYCARKFTHHVMHRARAVSNKVINDRADGHCYSFAWI